MPHFLIERTIFHQNVSMVSSDNKINNFTSGYQNLGYFKHYYRIKKTYHPITLSFCYHNTIFCFCWFVLPSETYFNLSWKNLMDRLKNHSKRTWLLGNLLSQLVKIHEMVHNLDDSLNVLLFVCLFVCHSFLYHACKSNLSWYFGLF